MRLSSANPGRQRRTLPRPLWWALLLISGLWIQELTGGLDFLTPALLLCLQTGLWLTGGWVALLLVLLQEGIGSLAFGTVILFYAGTGALFILARWLLEPENPLFILLYSFVLALWAWAVVSGAIAFQELPVAGRPMFPYILWQWLAYVIFWSAALVAYKRWCWYERI